MFTNTRILDYKRKTPSLTNVSATSLATSLLSRKLFSYIEHQDSSPLNTQTGKLWLCATNKLLMNTWEREKMGDWLTATRSGTTTTRSNKRPKSRGMTPSRRENATVHFNT